MKRFTDTEIWSAPWHRKLSPGAKLLWRWLCDNCDGGGVIEADFELAEFQIGGETDIDSAMDELGTRVEEIEIGVYLIPKFVGFQYGTPSEDCRAHGPIFKSLSKNGLEYDSINQRVSKGYPKGLNTPKEKEKETDKEKDRKPYPPDFESFWQAYPRRIRIARSRPCVDCRVSRRSSECS